MILRSLFKTEKAYNRVLMLHPICLLILWDMWSYCYERDLEFVVTETATTLEEDQELGRISSTHRDRPARAFDLRNRSWTMWEIKEFENHFNAKYNEKYGAITSQGNRRLIVSIKHGSGPHFHVQISREFSLDKSLE